MTLGIPIANFPCHWHIWEIRKSFNERMRQHLRPLVLYRETLEMTLGIPLANFPCHWHIREIRKSFNGRMHWHLRPLVLGPVDELATGFAMVIIDQGQGNPSDAMLAHRECGFSPDLIDDHHGPKGGGGSRRTGAKNPSTVLPVRPSGFFCHFSARASHEIHLEFVHRA